MTTDTTATLGSERELVLTRLIDAPRHKLYRAWTEPALLKQWFAPLPWTTPAAELDVRPGGANLVVMRGPDGNEFPNRGVYLEVVPNERLVFTDAFTEAWKPSEKPFMTVILTFEDAGGEGGAARRATPRACATGRWPTARRMRRWASTRAGGSAPTSSPPSLPSSDARRRRGPMLYAILCYNDEDVVWSWSKAEEDAVMAKLGAVQEKLIKAGKLGPSLRLLPTTAATTLRKTQEPPLVIDGPFAETKEQLLGFYVIDVADPRRGARRRPRARRGQSRRRLRDPPDRPLQSRQADRRQARRRGRMTDLAWINAALTAARPQAIGALLRYFRDLDTAEEAFQDACLRALKNWPQNGPPRDPTAWLILVGRNAALDGVRQQRQAGAAAAGRGDLRSRRRRDRRWPSGSTARTTATTCCGCCSSAAIRSCRRPSRSRWRCASSPASRSRRSPAPSWSARRRWSSASPAPRRASPTPMCRSRRPAPVERAERLAAVAAMIYLVFNEGYSAGDKPARAQLCDEAIRLARLLLRLFQTEPEIMGLTALMLLQHARARGAVRRRRRDRPAGGPGPPPVGRQA